MSGFGTSHAYVKVGVGALYRGVGKTKHKANNGVVCGMVGRTVVLWIREK